MSKFTPDHHRSRSKKSGAGSGSAGGRDLSTLQAAMMASESKVADWLAQNDPTLVRSESTEDDSKSIKSDVPVHLKRLKGGGSFLFTFVFVACDFVALHSGHSFSSHSAVAAKIIICEIFQLNICLFLCYERIMLSLCQRLLAVVTKQGD